MDENGVPLKIVYEQVSPRWEVACCLSSEKGFQQVSFVNSIATTKVRDYTRSNNTIIRGQLPLQENNSFLKYFKVYMNCLGLIFNIRCTKCHQMLSSQLKVRFASFSSVSKYYVKWFAYSLQGGRHVDYVVDQVTKKLAAAVTKKSGKNTSGPVKPFTVC